MSLKSRIEEALAAEVVVAGAEAVAAGVEAAEVAAVGAEEAAVGVGELAAEALPSEAVGSGIIPEEVLTDAKIQV